MTAEKPGASDSDEPCSLGQGTLVQNHSPPDWRQAVEPLSGLLSLRYTVAV